MTPNPFSSSFAQNAHFLATVFLVVLCLTMNWANILTFNFTVICINPKPENDDPILNVLLKSNHTDVGEPINGQNATKSEYEWWIFPIAPFYHKFTQGEQNQAMSIVAVGALIANFPVIVLINWHGPRYVFSVLGLMGALVTASVPAALHNGFYWFLGTRMLQGVAFAGDMATFGHFLAHWTCHRCYAFLTASLALYVQLAPFFTFPISGILCNSALGWPSVYYVHSLVSLLSFGAFMIFYRNNLAENGNKTAKNGNVSSEYESDQSQNGSGAHLTKHVAMIEDCEIIVRKARKIIPYKEIARSPAVWAIFVSAVGDFTAVNLLYQFTPTYLYRVQDLAVMETGLMATIPPLVQAVMKEVAGLINDRIPAARMDETAKTKLFNSVALLAVALFLTILAFVPRGHGYIALGLITAGEALLGFIIGGFYKSGPLISGIHAPFIMGQVSTALTLTMLVVPLLVNWLTPDNTQQEWALAFWLVASIAIAANTFYLFFAKGEPEPWSTVEHYLERTARKDENSQGKGQVQILINGKAGDPKLFH